MKFRRPEIFQTTKSVRSNSLSMKFSKFTPSGCKAIEIIKFRFVAKTQFLCLSHTSSLYMINNLEDIVVF